MTKHRVLPFPIEPARSEFSGAKLGDARRERRLAWLADRIADDPSQSFPEAWVSVAGAEAGYRFLSNRKVTAGAMLEPHRQRTVERGRSMDWVLALHDTTEMRFGGAKERDGLGPLMNGGQGFYLHAALLAGLDSGAERAVPLGLIGHEIVVRRPPQGKRPWREAYNDPDKESLRWNRLLRSVDADLRAQQLNVIHVADREASRYDLVAELEAAGARFILRLRKNFLERADTLSESGGVLDRVANVSVRLLERGGRRAKQPRDARIAKLAYVARNVRLSRPQHVDPKLGDQLELNVVEVREVSPPEGVEPINWTLITSEPIGTTAEVEQVIDGYRARWLIEEYWKALKTGCAFESRQLEALATLEKALALCIPIAWHMLLLRNIARDAPATPASRLLSPMAYQLLLTIAPTPANVWKFKLSAEPTAGELLLAIARMGGHLPNNGSPGFLTIRRGLDKLYELEAALHLARVEM
jgi:hypothetical protein